MQENVSNATGPLPPAGTITRAVLLGRRSLKRATMACGAVLRKYHNATRSRGAATGQLSYWDE